MRPQALYDEVVNDNVTALDVGENTPNLSADVIKNIEEAVSAQPRQTHIPDNQKQVRGEPKTHQIGQCQVKTLQGTPTVAGPQAHGGHHNSCQQSKDLWETHNTNTTEFSSPRQAGNTEDSTYAVLQNQKIKYSKKLYTSIKLELI